MLNKLLSFLIICSFLIPLGLSQFESNISKESVYQSILNSEKIIQEMENKDFGVNYVNDLLIEAKNVFEQASYVEILRGNSSESEKNIAREALRLINWKDIDYSDVMGYTSKIEERYNIAMDLYDSLSIYDDRMVRLSPEGINFSDTEIKLDEARQAFYEERYDDARSLLIMAQNSLEESRASSATIYGITEGAKSFIIFYWWQISILLIISLFIILYISKSIRINRIKYRILKLNLEKETLIELIKKAQIQRFKQGKISGLVYNIRVKKYNEKIHDIDEELPVLEKILNDMKKSSTKRISKNRKKRNR